MYKVVFKQPEGAQRTGTHFRGWGVFFKQNSFYLKHQTIVQDIVWSCCISRFSKHANMRSNKALSVCAVLDSQLFVISFPMSTGHSKIEQGCVS